MLERGKMDRDLVEFVVIDQLVPKEHLLRKIDAAVDFTQLYEMVEPLYCEDKGLAKAPATYDVKVPTTAVDGVTLTGATDVAAGTGVAVKAKCTDTAVYGYLVSIKGVGEKLVKTGVDTTIGVITVTDDVEIKASAVTVTKIAKMALKTDTADTKNWSGNKIVLTFTNNVDEASALAPDSIVVEDASSTAVDANIVVDGNNVKVPSAPVDLEYTASTKISGA